MHKQRMRIAPGAPPAEWKTLVVDADDPVVFAQQLQTSLQELTNENFTIVNQMQRGCAHIIVANRIQPAPAPRAPAAAARRCLVEATTAPPRGDTSEEVLYHYYDGKEQKQAAFPTLLDAVRAMKDHYTAACRGTGDAVPISIVTVSTTRFEFEGFSALLKMFAEELKSPPG